MATKKALDRMQELAEKNGKANAIRNAAAASVGEGVTEADRKAAQEWLAKDRKTPKKVTKAIENAMESAGAKPKNPVRRFFQR